MRAADAGVISVVQRIVGNLILLDVVPNHRRAPIGDGVDFVESKFCVPLDLARRGAVGRLIAANGCGPRAEPGELAAKRLDLSKIAALVRIAGPECRTMSEFLAKAVADIKEGR